VLQLFELRHFHVNRLPSSSSSLSMSPRFRHCLSYSSPDPCSHPFSGFMAPLWILGPSLSSSVSAICYVLSVHPLFRRNLVFSPHHRYPYLSISFFAFDIRCPCSPTCFFRS
jgi:hypothetical protein